MDPLSFFEAAHEAYRQAERAAGGPAERSLRVAGHTVHLRFAGPVLVRPMTRAFAHLVSGPAVEPGLTVHLWDSVSTGVPMPPPPWGSGAYGARGEVVSFLNERIHITYNVLACSLSLIDLERGLALYWIPETDPFPMSESAGPLRTVLYRWMRSRGLYLVHAAAVGRPDGGVLIAGRSGSGKSTVALACAGSRIGYAGDDHCLLEAGLSPSVYGVYATGRHHPVDAPRFPRLARYAGTIPPGEKALYFMNEIFPDKVLRSFPLRSVLVPRWAKGPGSSIHPAPRGAALRALAPSTLFQMPGAGTEDFGALAATVREAGAFYLDIGSDLEALPDLIAGHLDAPAGAFR